MVNSKIKKLNIILIVSHGFTNRDYHRYGIELFEKKSVNIEVWDITKLVNEDFINQEPQFSNDNIFVFRTIKNLKRKITTIKNETWINPIFRFNIKTFWIYQSLKKKNIKLFVNCNNHNPVCTERKTVIQKIKSINLDKLKNYIRSQAEKIVLRLMCLLFPLKPLDIIFGGGKQSINAYNRPCPIDKSTILINIHSFDYDTFIKERNLNSFDKKEYVLFIDQYLPYHPDFELLSVKHSINPDTYYNELNKVFDFLESKHKVQVLIAAHPRAVYKDKGNVFNGRNIIHKQTNQLIKNSKFIIMHNSTAINFAVIYKKPIVFLVSQNLPHYLNQSVKCFAKKLSKSPVDMNDKVSEFDLSVDKDSYKEYWENYIKAGKNEHFFWDNVIEALRVFPNMKYQK